MKAATYGIVPCRAEPDPNRPPQGDDNDTQSAVVIQLGCHDSRLSVVVVSLRRPVGIRLSTTRYNAVRREMLKEYKK